MNTINLQKTESKTRDKIAIPDNHQILVNPEIQIVGYKDSWNYPIDFIVVVIVKGSKATSIAFS